MKITIDGIEIEREIVALDKLRAQVIVQWSNEDIPAGIRVAVDLPIEGGSVPAGDDLDRYLVGFCPIDEFRRRKLVRTGTINLDHIERLVRQQEGLAHATQPVLQHDEIPSL